MILSSQDGGRPSLAPDPPPLERHAKGLFIAAAVFAAVAALVAAATLADPSLLDGPWSTVAFFASALAAAALTILRRSRRRLTPLAGLGLGVCAALALPSVMTVPRLDGFVTLVLSVLEQALHLTGRDSRTLRIAIDGVLSQRAGLVFFLGNLLIVMAYAAVSLPGVRVLAWIGRAPAFGALRRWSESLPWTSRFLSLFTLAVAAGAWGLLVACAALAAWRGGREMDTEILGGFVPLVWAATFILLVEVAAAFRPALAYRLVVEPAPEPLPAPDPSRIRRLHAALENSGVAAFVSLEPSDGLHGLRASEDGDGPPGGLAAAVGRIVGRRAAPSAPPLAAPSAPPAPRSGGAARAGAPADPRVAAVLDTVAASLAERDTPEAVAEARTRLADPVAAFYAADALVSCALLFDETVTTTHYRLLVTMMLTALDTGGVALVICPDGQDRDVHREIESVLERTRAGLVAETLLLGESFDRDQLYGVLVASETAFERNLLADAGSRRRELDRLALVVGLDMHRTDLPRMSMMVRRLRQEVAFDEIRFAFVLTDFAEPKDVVRQILLAGSPREVLRVRIGSRAAEGQYRFALIDDEANRAKLRAMAAGIGRSGDKARAGLGGIRDTAALVAVAAMETGLDVVFHDPRGRRLAERPGRATRQTWSDETVKAVEYFFDAGYVRRFNEIVARRSLPTDDTLSRFGRVVIVEEGFNADAALTRPYDFLDQYPTLVVVLLRDVHLMSDRAVLEEFGPAGPIPPVAPTPTTGAREIAYILESRLRDRTNGVGEMALSDFLGGVPEKVKAGYEFAANRAGLTRLLAKATGATSLRFRPDTTDPETGEPRFSLDHPPPEAGLTVPLSIRSVLDVDTVRIVANDVGLRFVKDAYTAVRRPFERVGQVSAGELTVEPAQTECLYEKRRFARLCPAYAVDLSAGSGFVVEDGPSYTVSRKVTRQGRFNQTRLHCRTVLLSAPVERSVTVWFDEIETVPPLAPDGSFAGDERAAEDVRPVARAMRLLQIVWVLEGDIGQTVAGQPAPARAEPPPGPPPSEPPPGPDPDIVGATAFAAVVLMKEAIAACFPGQGHRVAVFSPQASGRLEREAERTDTGVRYFAHRFALRSRVRDADRLEDLLDEAVRPPFRNPAWSRIDLFVIEDSEWSLGILETLEQRGADVYRFMRRAAVRTPTFGAEKPPPYMDGGRLLGFLDAWIAGDQT